ncbi:MAG: hypothetical protein ACRDTE_27635 [Pseudonocardiaceae bacterium]
MIAPIRSSSAFRSRNYDAICPISPSAMALELPHSPVQVTLGPFAGLGSVGVAARMSSMMQRGPVVLAS